MNPPRELLGLKGAFDVISGMFGEGKLQIFYCDHTQLALNFLLQSIYLGNVS